MTYQNRGCRLLSQLSLSTGQRTTILADKVQCRNSVQFCAGRLHLHSDFSKEGNELHSRERLSTLRPARKFLLKSTAAATRHLRARNLSASRRVSRISSSTSTGQHREGDGSSSAAEPLEVRRNRAARRSRAAWRRKVFSWAQTRDVGGADASGAEQEVTLPTERRARQAMAVAKCQALDQLDALKTRETDGVGAGGQPQKKWSRTS